MLKTLLSLVGVAVALYAGVAVVVFLSQKSLIFYPEQPTRGLVATPGEAGMAYEEVTLTSEDGVELHGWYVPAREARGVLLFCHGNAGNISHRLESIEIFHRLGLSVLIFDYRGYGRSRGRISEAGTYRDARAAWRYLTSERDVPADRIVIFGRSLGAAVAAHLAAEVDPAALILESAFTSVPGMGSELYPYLPVRLLSRYQYDTERALGGIDSPVLVIHSPQDEIIPFEQGRRLFEAANEPKQFLTIAGGHNGGFLVSGERYFEGIGQFLAKHLGDDPLERAEEKDR